MGQAIILREVESVATLGTIFGVPVLPNLETSWILYPEDSSV